MTIDKIEIRSAATVKTTEVETDNDSLYTVLFEGEKVIDLLDLQNGITEELLSMDLEAGSYDLIRLHVTSAKIILDRETGRSRGFGFVEMPNDAEANSAIEKINQTEHVGKVLNVTEARPKAEGTGGNRGGFGGRNNNDRGPKRY